MVKRCDIGNQSSWFNNQYFSSKYNQILCDMFPHLDIVENNVKSQTTKQNLIFDGTLNCVSYRLW